MMMNRFCNKCGHAVFREAAFCPFCGAGLVSDNAAFTQSASAQPVNSWYGAMNYGGPQPGYYSPMNQPMPQVPVGMPVRTKQKLSFSEFNRKYKKLPSLMIFAAIVGILFFGSYVLTSRQIVTGIVAANLVGVNQILIYLLIGCGLVGRMRLVSPVKKK